MSSLRMIRFVLLLCVVGTKGVWAQQADPPQGTLSVDVNSATTEEQSGNTRPNGLVSLVDVSPSTFYTILRHWKFYGDSRTKDGNIFERSYLTGDWGGLRQELFDRGVYLNFSGTQFGEDIVKGGLNKRRRFNGSFDASLALDTAKLGLWSGGLFYIHGERNWGKSVNEDSGAIVPFNMDALQPKAKDTKTALSEFYLTQAFGDKGMLAIGKYDLAGWPDQNLFANNWRRQFQMASLVNNPQLGAFAPYTTFNMSAMYNILPDFTAVYTVNTNSTKATKAGFNKIFKDGTTHTLLFQYNANLFGNLPGIYEAVAGFSTKDFTDFAINTSLATDEFLGTKALKTGNNNWGATLSFSQYLWRQGPTWAKDDPDAPERPLGGGVFLRYGHTPAKYNVIEDFVSFGIAGSGGPGNRYYDNWGIGYSGSKISSDLRELVDPYANLSKWEHAAEVFYNFRVTPAAYLGAHVQYVDPAIKEAKHTWNAGLRLQLDF